MNEMFKRIAALLDSQTLHKRPAWAGRPPKPPAEPAVDRAEHDFEDTDIAVAWLCEASNKTRTAGQNELR